MLRRCIPPTTAHAVITTTPQSQHRSFLGGMFGGKKKTEADDAGKKDQEGASSSAGGFPGTGAMPGFDPRRMKEFMSKPPEEQIQFMRSALEMQKKVGGSVPGLGKMNNMNVRMMEQMIDGLEKTIGKADGAKGSTTATTTTTPVTTHSSSTTTTSAKSNNTWRAPNNNSSHASSSGASTSGGRTASPLHTAQPVSNDPPPGPNAFKNASGPTLDELRKINLGPEIEELFTELRHMRGKRDHYRSQMDKAEVALKYTASELKETQEKAADLRKRLGNSEQTVTKLTAENLALQQRTAELQQVQSQVRSLNTTVSALKGNDTAPLNDRIAQLERALSSANDHNRSLQRKLDRARKKDPVLQFSLQVLTELASLKSAPSVADAEEGCFVSQGLDGMEFSVAGAGADTTRASDAVAAVAEEAFSSLQETYNRAADGVWESNCVPESTRALVVASSDFVATRIGRPLSSFDAVVTLVKGQTAFPAELKESLSQQGFVVAAAPGSAVDDASFVVTAGTPLIPAMGFLGPFGACKLIFDIAKLSGHNEAASHRIQSAAGDDVRTLLSSVASVVARVVPHISAELAKDPRRSRVDIHTSRSSGPGGQAANVGETQITANLLIDGIHVLTSECQDSRSAMNNKDVALSRLYGEKLDRLNKQTLVKLRVSNPLLTVSSADSAERAGLPSDRWEHLCGGAVTRLSKDKKIVQWACVVAAQEALCTPDSL